ncbi:MAG: NAD(P)/FAD-dependent oxidoreductase [Nocardioidaceae bacterium]
MSRKRVVIVGGGFAGLFAARGLRRSPVEVVLVNRTAHHLFQPLLYQVATGVLSEGQIAVPLRALMKRYRNVETLLAEVTSVDVVNHVVRAERPGSGSIDLHYDFLVVAAGVTQSYFGHGEYAPYAPGMKTLGDALEIRRKVFGAFEMAQTADDPAERRRWLTFALVGAGPTGVELAGQIRELATQTLREQFDRIDPGEARVLLFDGGHEPLAAFGQKLSAKASEALTGLGVEQHMGALVTEVDALGLLVRARSGEIVRYDAGTVLWTAGVVAPHVASELARSSGATQDRAGRIEVTPELTVKGHPEIFVVGDMMSLDKLPGVAEVAMQAGWYAARRIRAEVAGEPRPGPFRYHDLGSAAYIARGRAVVSVGPLHLSGRLGWLAWLFVHIAFLTGYRNRVTAVLTWAMTFSRETRRERAFLLHQQQRAPLGADPGDVPQQRVSPARTRSPR